MVDNTNEGYLKWLKLVWFVPVYISAVAPGGGDANQFKIGK